MQKEVKNKSAYPLRQIRAVYDETTVRVYQAYRNDIADTALANGRFVSPPFSMTRMTWIKPSFLWMMYRAGWGFKDSGQNRILAVDISREGFEWALAHSCLSHGHEDLDPEEWERRKVQTPVRIQWDPERNLHFHPLDHRSIQIGLKDEAAKRYATEWTAQITEITDLAHSIHRHVEQGRLAEATTLLPQEREYPLSPELAKKIGLSIGDV